MMARVSTSSLPTGRRRSPRLLCRMGSGKLRFRSTPCLEGRGGGGRGHTYLLCLENRKGGGDRGATCLHSHGSPTVLGLHNCPPLSSPNT